MVKFSTDNGVNAKSTSELVTKEEIRDYMKVFPEIMQELTKLSLKTYQGNGDMSQMTHWMSKVVNYNVSSEPRVLGGLLVPAAYKFIVGERKDTGSFNLAYIMGWQMEISHGAKLMSDNIMDDQISLNIDQEKPAWHTVNHVGMSAVNDNFVLKVVSYNILKIFFSDKPYYHKLQDFSREGYQKIVLGRALWEQMEKADNLAQSYTLERYRQVVSFMTSYYSFYMPVETVLIMAEVFDDEPERKKDLKELMLHIGYYHQLKVDFEDTFGGNKGWLDNATGKMRRLTWFFVKALEESNNEQSEAIIKLTNNQEENKENVGNKIRKIYSEMGLIEKFQLEKAAVFVEIQKKIENLSKYSVISPQFFYNVLTEIETQFNYNLLSMSNKFL